MNKKIITDTCDLTARTKKNTLLLGVGRVLGYWQLRGLLLAPDSFGISICYQLFSESWSTSV